MRVKLFISFFTVFFSKTGETGDRNCSFLYSLPCFLIDSRHLDISLSALMSDVHLSICLKVYLSIYTSVCLFGILLFNPSRLCALSGILSQKTNCHVVKLAKYVIVEPGESHLCFLK